MKILGKGGISLKYKYLQVFAKVKAHNLIKTFQTFTMFEIT